MVRPPPRRTSDRRAGLLRPAQDGLDARDELARAERLGEVVVGAQLEPQELVQLVVARGEHHDGQRRGARGLAGHVEAVELRQPEVEHHEVGVPPVDGLDRRATVDRRQDGEPGVLQVVAGEGDDLRLVVDDEDGLHRATS